MRPPRSLMTYAAITGWGKCMPPAVLTNADLATLMETDDEWITSRTGIHERRVSHVTGIELSHVAAARALACAGLDASDVDLIVYGSCSNDETVPNSASGVQLRLGAPNAAAMDVNTACTSFLYGLSTATAMIRTGVVRNAVVVGVELISPFMDWTNRGVAVLFGDGAAAVVLQATDREEGVIGEKLGCYADVRSILRVRGMGTTYAHHGVMLGDTSWDFDGQEIFKRAVLGMSKASQDVLAKTRAHGRRDRPRHPAPGEPAHHRVGGEAHRHADGARVRDGAALRQHVVGDGAGRAGRSARGRPRQAGRAHPDAGVRRRAHVVLASRFAGASATTPLGTTDLELPPPTQTALERVRELIAIKQPPTARTPDSHGARSSPRIAGTRAASSRR